MCDEWDLVNVFRLCRSFMSMFSAGPTDISSILYNTLGCTED